MQGEVKFGVFDHMDSSGRSLREQYEDRLYLCEAYDRCGFHAYHVAEHHSTPLGRAPSPSVFLAAIAQRTKSLRFGPLVYALSLYHPLRAIEEICMLDQMSDGRFELGVGPGISPIELGFYGVDAKQAKDIYVEATEIILKGLTTDRLSHSGQHFQFNDVPMELVPAQRPHPPIWIGASRADSAAFAAAKSFNLVTNGKCTEVRAISDRYRAEWQALGHSATDMPFVGMSRHIVVAPTESEAREIARKGYAGWFASLLHLWRKWGSLPPTLSFPEDFDAAERMGFCIVGTPAGVREKVRTQLAESGVNYFLCRMAFGEMTREHSLRSAEMFAAEVMPAFADKASAA